jgi:hypothetical protein
MAPLEAVATTTMSSRVEAAGRMPSMEWEPKTLTLDQIKFARVSAYCVEPLHMHCCPCVRACIIIE